MASQNGRYLPKVYYPELKEFTGNTNSALLFRQLEYWFYKKDYEPFYKYLEKPNEPTKAYHNGDSWCEELGLSRREFRIAFSKIGIAWDSYKQQEKSGYGKFGDGPGMMYCSIRNRITKMTYYYRNEYVVSEMIANNNLDYCFEFE